MEEQAERSIGEVLALLKIEFNDITISKIRFLESQGLLTPKRTASGYRKFSDSDVSRLRYILREQKEHFLPLKVIKDRLTDTSGETAPETAVSPDRPHVNAHEPAVAPAERLPLTRRQLLDATGLTEAQLRELEGFGLVRSDIAGKELLYGAAALQVARLASRFLQFGVEARHLRIFATSAAREADLYRQLAPASPTGTRNSQAKMDMQARLEALVELGGELHAQLLRISLAR